MTQIKKNGVRVTSVQNPEQGAQAAKEILYKSSNNKTVLFLSGGRTPKTLYELLTQEKKLQVGAVGMVDERYGKPFHEFSNELMIKNTGLLEYLQIRNIQFYSMLKGVKLRHLKGGSKKAPLLSDYYNRIIRNLFDLFPKRIAIMGIGADGHTAGLPPRIQKSKIKNQKLVTEFEDFPAAQKERITMTFDALSKLDLLIVLVFGDDKKQALIKMFERGSEQEIPARFFLRPEIASKTLLITDQKI